MNKKVLTIGDIMLDCAISGTTDRISPEAPVPIILKQSEKWKLGAAANVASHITAAGVDCLLAYKAGAYEDSEDGRHFMQMCVDRQIYLRPLQFPGYCPITVKTRVWSGGQQVCRIDQESVSKPDVEIESAWIKHICSIIRDERVDIVVFSDYDKGTLTDPMILNIADECTRLGIKTILDPKRPTFPRFKNLTLVKPNRREIKATNLTAEECSAKMGNVWLINTLGEQGMVAYRDGKELFGCPTVAQEVIDVCGCGDTVTAVLALALLEGFDMHSAVKVANHGASYTIKHRGCYVLSHDEIRECIDGKRT